MQYNSRRENLVIPEYGRHVQKLIEHIKTVEDKEKRQQLAEGMVKLMLQMVPAEHRAQEYTDKMWAHMLKIANYELDVDVPEGVSKEKPEMVSEAPKGMEYPKAVKRYRHYGQYIQVLISKALEMEDGPKKQEFVRIIGSYMKTAYKQWNRDHYVNDESVLEDIKIITKGELSISDDASFDYLKNTSSGYKGKGRKSNSNRNYSNKKMKKGSYKKRKQSY